MATTVTTNQWTSTNKDVSLAVRKHFRDTEEKKLAHLKEIETTVGKKLDLEMQGMTPAELYTALKIEDLPKIFLDSYVASIASLFKRFCEDDVVKGALAEDLNKIVIRIDPNCTGYPEVTVENGSLILTCSKNPQHLQISSQTKITVFNTLYQYPTSETDAKTDSTEDWDYHKKSAPIAIRTNLKQFEPKRDEYLARIEKAFGKKLKLEFQGMRPGEMYHVRNNKEYTDLGRLYFGDFMEQLALLFEKNCKDEMTKEALQEVVNKLVIRNNSKFGQDGALHRISIEDGALVLELGSFVANISEVSNTKIDSLL